MTQARVRGCLLCATALLGVLAASGAQAGGFAIREQSTTGLGAAFAGVAAGGGGGSISGMFWNPAVITQSSSWQSESHAALIAPQSDLTIDLTRSTLSVAGGGVALSALGPLAGASSSDIDQAAVVPASYGALQISENVYIGLSMNAPFGLVTDASNGWAGRYHAQTSDVFTFNATPTIGYKVNDMISVAAGVQIAYIDARLTSSTIIGAGPTDGTVVVTGDDWGFGGTIGVTLTPMEGTSVGLGYRSRVKNTLEGNAVLGGPTGTVTSLGGITGDITLPDTVTFGVRHDLNPEWTLLAGVEWSNWSTFDDLTINRSNGTVLSTTPENWDDGWFFSLGAEYHYSDRTTFRFGGAYELSPVPDGFRTPRIPDADRIWASIGISHQINSWISVDAAYTHIFVDDAPINLTLADNPTRGALVGSADGSVDIVGVSVKFNWGSDEAPRLFGN